MRLTSRLFASLTFVAAASACGPGTLSVNVNLITKTCGTEMPLGGSAAVLRFTVFGDGIDSTQSQTEAVIGQATSAQLPSIPVGANRNIVAEVFDQHTVLLARGETGPVDFNGKLKTENVTIFLRPTNAFTYASSASDPATCTSLANARAHHTATTLENGKVLIAGGLTLSGNTPTYLASTEIYDPQTGSVTAGPNLVLKRAYHTATHLPGTTLTVIAGGENGTGQAGGALGVGEVYDESSNSFAAYPMKQARTRHAAGVPLPFGSGGQPGLVLIMGGEDATGSVETSIEAFSPAQGFFSTGSVALPHGRAEATAVPIAGGVLLVGGWGGSAGTANDVAGVTSPDNLMFGPFSGGVTLQSPHVFPLAAALGDGSIVVADGSSTNVTGETGLNGASNIAEVIPTSHSGSVTTGGMDDNQRVFGGAVSLLDGRVLIAGGGDMNGALKSAEIAFRDPTSGNVKFTSGSDSPTPMSDARIGAAYTLMNDGSVLITGGFNGTMPSMLKSIEVFEPAYQILTNNPHL